MTNHSDETTTSPADRYLVLGMLCLVAVIAYIQRAALSFPAKEIASDLRLQDVAIDMGWIQFAWYFSYAMFQIPSGWFADRLGSRRALAMLCALWSIATLLSGFAWDFWSLLAVWASMGAAQAGVFPCAAKAIGQLFSETERSRASGLLACGMMTGGAVASLLTAQLLDRVAPWAETSHVEPWRVVFVVYFLLGVLWAGGFLVVISPRRLPCPDASASRSQSTRWSRLLTSGSMWLLCGQQFFRAAGMVFFVTWFPTFLRETRGVSQLESGVFTTVAGVGGILGSLSGGFVSDLMLQRTGNSRLSRQGIAVCGMASCAVLIAGSYFIADVRGAIALIALGAFCATFGGVSGYTVAIKFGGQQVATVFSVMNMCGNIGASLFPAIAGLMVSKTGNWNLMLFLFAGIMAVDAVCWAFLNPPGTLFDDQDAVSHAGVENDDDY